MKSFRQSLALSLAALAAGCDMAIDNSIASLWNSFWQGPKVGGMLFGAILLVSLFAIRTFKVYRARVSNGDKFKKVSDKYKGRRLKRNPNGTDKYAHVDANTMSLGVRKLFKTGAPYDNGVMTHE
jgi:hypothetical protein